jgi:hypothetical protein
MNQQNILPSTKEFNISWTTDSYAPLTDYFLYYRKNKVNWSTLFLLAFCFTLDNRAGIFKQSMGAKN